LVRILIAVFEEFISLISRRVGSFTENVFGFVIIAYDWPLDRCCYGGTESVPTVHGLDSTRVSQRGLFFR
jgi:hypothetical protein